MSSPVWRKFYGSVFLAANLSGQRRIAFLPREKLEAIRDRRIRSLVGYAARTVPYYREWFAREGVDPRRIQAAADLERLPVLDRELVQAQPHRFIAEGRAGREAIPFLTTGTTGTPLEFHHDRLALLANVAFGERERLAVIQICGGSLRPREINVGYHNSTLQKVLAFYDQNLLMPLRPRRKCVSLLQTVEEIAAIANAERPEVLAGYGGWIDLFFKTIAARNIQVHLPRVVIYGAEALSRGSRDFIEHHFGIPVLSRYNAVEAFKIGFFCERRRGFHLHEDLCHVRIVGSDGNDVAPGEKGRVVITNLVNRASVLLNYSLGDVASFSREECPCGRNLRLLSEVEGRVEDFVTLADGRCIHPRGVWDVFKGDGGILQYQLTQHELTRFELQLTTVDESAFQQALQDALPKLKQVLGPGARVEAWRSNQVQRATPGKFRAVISHCKPPI